jgi:hypothetical protein
MSLTVRTVSPAAAATTPVASIGLTSASSNIEKKVQNARKNAKASLSLTQRLTQKASKVVYGRNSNRFKSQVETTLKGDSEAIKLYQGNYLSSRWDTLYANKFKGFSTSMKLFYAERGRNEAAAAGTQLCASVLFQASIGAAAGVGLLGATAGTALPVLAGVAMIAAFCREKYVRFQTLIKVFNVLSDEIGRMIKVVEVIRGKGWNINFAVFNEAVFALFSYMGSLTDENELATATKVDSSRMPSLSSVGALFKRTMRYFNPFEIAAVITERLGRVTASFSIIVAEYTVLSLGGDLGIAKVEGAAPETIEDIVKRLTTVAAAAAKPEQELKVEAAATAALVTAGDAAAAAPAAGGGRTRRR